MKRISLCIASFMIMHSMPIMGMGKQESNPAADDAPLITPPTTPKTPKSVPSTPKEYVAAMWRHRSSSQSKIFDDADHPIKSAKSTEPQSQTESKTQK